MYINIFRRFKEAVRRKLSEKWRSSSLFLLHYNAPAHRSVMVKDFLVKTMWQHWRILHTLLTWLQLIFTCSLDWNQHWRDGAFVMPQRLRMRRKSWKGFHKMASRNVSNICTVAGRSAELHKLKEISWNDCTVWYFSEMKWFREQFEATTYVNNIEKWGDTNLCWTLLDDNEFKTEYYVSVRSKVRTNGECRCVSCIHSLHIKWIDTGVEK
jgi:hypothetical protein